MKIYAIQYKDCGQLIGIYAAFTTLDPIIKYARTELRMTDEEELTVRKKVKLGETVINMCDWFHLIILDEEQQLLEMNLSQRV